VISSVNVDDNDINVIEYNVDMKLCNEKYGMHKT